MSDTATLRAAIQSHWPSPPDDKAGRHVGHTFLRDPGSFREIHPTPREAVGSLPELQAYLAGVTLEELLAQLKTHGNCVIYHELCHLKEHHHGRAFYSLLDRVLPEWRERKRKLEVFDFG